MAEGCLLQQCKWRRHRCLKKERGGIEVLMLQGVVEAWIAATYFAFIWLFSVVRWQKLLLLKGRNCSGISRYSHWTLSLYTGQLGVQSSLISIISRLDPPICSLIAGMVNWHPLLPLYAAVFAYAYFCGLNWSKRKNWFWKLHSRWWTRVL